MALLITWWPLSFATMARAVNVLRYFIEIGGISASRLSAIGCGEFQPLVPNDRNEHRSQNRRVAIIFLNSEKKSSPVEGMP